VEYHVREEDMSVQLPPDRFIKVGDINTRYWEAGDKGSAVVLVHGLGGFIENWVYNINVLAERHRVYAMDLVGFGRSDKTPLTHDMNVLVKFINDFMKTMNIAKASLIGNSLGGGLALLFALDFPEKVEKLVLADNAGMGRDVIIDFKLCSLPIIGELLTRPSLKGTARLWKEIVYDAALITPELVNLGYGIISQPGAKKALLTTLRAGIDLRGQRAKLVDTLLSRLNTITAPTLVVWGKEDRIIPVAHARVAAAKIPGARLEIFDRCGHMPQLEHSDKFNKLVLDFLVE
jgi:4,5:9,10-diseco-3-hydroxy-5,9,17-trioxoandrosta-1(10),2-diene-4-oate hydrolase